MTTKIVSYLRCSTQRQNRSGLGLEAQRAAVEAHANHVGASVVREYVEVESGKNNDRPKLAEALAYARRARATLLVARLDRLARNVKFIATVMDSGVEFAAVELPFADRTTLHVMAAMAEREGIAISQRTTAALAAAKARGTKLGTHNPSVPVLTLQAARKGRMLGVSANRQQASKAYEDLAPYVATLRTQGFSLRAIAQQLNDDGHETRNAKAWSAPQVLRLLRRAA
jgi:DNA invertase Pin-like site-specific DNA recombinase